MRHATARNGWCWLVISEKTKKQHEQKEARSDSSNDDF